MIKYVVFIGKPGSGKGTQAQYFSKLGWVHLSTGDLFRKHLSERTKLGEEIRSYVESGALVPDDVTFAVVEDYLNDLGQKARVIFDGFPRTKSQAELLDEWAQKSNAMLVCAVEFFVSDEEAIKRLTNRYYCPVCGYVSNQPGLCVNDGTPLVKRLDDNEEVIRKRVSDYSTYASELRAFYQDKGKYVAVDGNQAPEHVSAFLERIMQ
jgi:adenylate kinase